MGVPRWSPLGRTPARAEKAVCVSRASRSRESGRQEVVNNGIKSGTLDCFVEYGFVDTCGRR